MNNYNQNPTQDQELAFDATIIEDSMGFETLPDGNYQFTVSKFERERYEPSPKSKISACNKVTVYIDVVSPTTGRTIGLKDNLFLLKSMEWRLSQFFTSIGQKKKGQPLQMNWQTVIGSKGIVKVGHREYNGSVYNDVKGYEMPINYEQPQVEMGYTPGQFGK